MDFNNILNGHTCKCLDNCIEDNSNIFARKVSKNKLTNSDFKTHFERNKIPESEDCEFICGYRGISIYIWDESSKEQLKQRFSVTNNLSPQSKKNIAVFSFKKDAGLLKNTPNQAQGFDEFHYDFFKCDGFTLERVDFKELISI